ncbi:E3 ubiquitin-protein ligase TRIM39-like [Latimeria chalumnae]|uniref:E3 ubiquitin-protein ligase TRIM39-like n=1 Tax=Latimeria chalumnae TaxID=7897 RepID=UPI00313D3F00
MIEHCFGQLKMQFRCLDCPGDFLPLAPAEVCKVFLVCCMLHNIIRWRQLPLPEEVNIAAEEDDGVEDVEEVEVVGILTVIMRTAMGLRWADSAISDLITNHTLRNIVDTYKKEGKKPKEESESVCSQHKKVLELYCLEDQEAICVICEKSRKHKNHEFLPIEEAAQEFKQELKESLKPLKDTQRKIAELKEKYRGNLSNIHDQADKTEKQIKEDFVKLHRFLHEEEKNLLADLKKEKKEKEQKMRAMEESIEHDLTSVSKIIKYIQQKIDEEDQIFLKTLQDMRERIKEYADYKPREPKAVSTADIDGYKYTDRLQYRVWKKMLKIINPVTVTLDPNTAHPRLTLSEDLTAVTDGSTRRKDLPDNPERFDYCVMVLGSEGFTSGRHSWVVNVGNKTDWDLGVARESAKRKGEITLSPKLGYWTLVLRDGGKYSAGTDGWTRLKLEKSLKKVLVCVDYEAGKVSFYNADDMSHIYTFTDNFTEKIFPFFCPCYNSDGKNGEPLRIRPL